MTYNGHKNYETWAVSLFLDGNYDGEGTYRDVLMIVELHAETSVNRLADALKDYVEDRHGDVFEGASLVSDLFGAALSEVDWRALALSLCSELEPTNGANT